jgi:peptide/nickel transport system permease protein
VGNNNYINNKNPNKSLEHAGGNVADDEYISMSTELGDEQRVKVLSPGAMVIKRFIRNKLAIVGFFIIVFMFLFSFVGSLLSPYDETQVFTYVGTMSKEYASVTQNNEFRYTVEEGKEYGDIEHSKFILAKNNGESFFNSGGEDYNITQEGEEFYRITHVIPVANVTYFKGLFDVMPFDGQDIDEKLEAEVYNALESSKDQFEYENEVYTVQQVKRDYVLGKLEDVAIESMLIIDPAQPDLKIDYDFKLAAEKAINTTGAKSFTVKDQSFEVEVVDGIAGVYENKSGERIPYAVLSDLAIQPVSPEMFFTIEFKMAIQQAISEELTSFSFADESGSNVEYSITRLNNVFTIKTETLTHLISMHEQPSKKHWLGTDSHGMDVLTRLMYGGQISLVIGFIVVLLETLIGVILGGLSGYFGKWEDMLIMRIVDIFNCIPFLPLMIILGSVMDAMDVDPQIRIYYLMIVMGLMSWPGIARMVRGQILSLREQEFMIAAEATGLKVSKRIFKHLIPNVIPQLIVLATMGLGSVILYESTISYLGLGVKFPFASWGNIISGVSTAYEMTNFWFVWIPAGLLILLTVLGFNFVGDGLRDAFDPKMKR